MKTTTKKRKKLLTFEELLHRVQRHQDYLDFLKTAAQTGWLTDATFVTMMTPEERVILQGLYRDTPDARSATVLEITDPQIVGPLAIHVERQGRHVRLASAAGLEACVNASLFETLQQRHPAAHVYLWQRDPDIEPVIFSARTTVALLQPVQR